MKSLLAFVLLCRVAATLALPKEQILAAAAARENCDCQCDNYTWNYRGKIMGNCKRYILKLSTFLMKTKAYLNILLMMTFFITYLLITKSTKI
jgi:hypothetical protein